MKERTIFKCNEMYVHRIDQKVTVAVGSLVSLGSAGNSNFDPLPVRYRVTAVGIEIDTTYDTVSTLIELEKLTPPSGKESE